MSTQAQPQADPFRPAMADAANIGSRRVDSPTRRAVRRFVRHRLAMFGLIVLCLMALAAICAPLIAPYAYYEQDLTRFRQAPSADHLLGTDTFGRDVLSRLIFGTRVSLSVGLIAVGIYETIAVILGAISGYYGGTVDLIIMRIVDVVMTLPWLIVIVFMVSILGPSIFNTMIAIAALGWTGPSRLVRGQILSLREMDYVMAARSVGVQPNRIIVRHVLPNAIGPIIVESTLELGYAIIEESGLSFLGFGIQPPTPSWGNLLSNAQEHFLRHPWLAIFPGLMIFLAIISVNYIGDGLRDAYDPYKVLQKVGEV